MRLEEGEDRAGCAGLDGTELEVSLAACHEVVRIDRKREEMIRGIARNLAAYARGVRLQNGDRVRVSQEIRTTGVAYYHAPATTGFGCRLPVGAFLRVYAEPSRFSFMCTVDDPEVESQVVPATALNDEKYAGAAFRFGYGELGRRLALITE